jgi:Cu2+-containing amine oxidase
VDAGRRRCSGFYNALADMDDVRHGAAPVSRLHAAISTHEVVKRIRDQPTVPVPKGKWSTTRWAKRKRWQDLKYK